MKSYTNAILQLALERLILTSVSHTSIIAAGLTSITFVKDISSLNNDTWSKSFEKSIDHNHSKAILTLQKEYPTSIKKDFVLVEVKTLLNQAINEYEYLRKKLENKIFRNNKEYGKVFCKEIICQL